MNDDVVSNYSYALDSATRKEVKEISKQMNKVSLEELDLSFDLSGNGANKKGEGAYNWKGSSG
jgi:hypothetical protein